jgi:hypothetical protein
VGYGGIILFLFCNWGPKRYSHQRESHPNVPKKIDDGPMNKGLPKNE